MEFGVVASLFVKHTGLSPDRTFCVFVWGLMTKPTRWRLFFFFFFFGDASCDMNSVHPSSLTAPFKSTCKHLRGWWHDAVSESAMSSVFCFFLFSMCYSVLFFGIVVTEGFHFMPNDWTFTLLFHFRSGCVWRKMHHLFFPWSFLHLLSNLALAWHFSFLSNAVGFVSFFFSFFFSLPNFNFTFMSQEQTFIWRVWRYSSCLIAGSGVYEEYICCWLGRSLPVISLQQTCAQIQTDAAGSDFWWFKKKREREKTTTKQLFSNRAVSTMQEWAIHPHRPTIPKCLSDDSSNHVNSILWFLYRSSSRTSSTVCLWCIFAFLLCFFGVVLMSSPLPRAPGSRGK